MFYFILCCQDRLFLHPLLEGQGAVIMFSLIGLKCCLVRRRFASETINVPDISIFP